MKVELKVPKGSNGWCILNVDGINVATCYSADYPRNQDVLFEIVKVLDPENVLCTEAGRKEFNLSIEHEKAAEIESLKGEQNELQES